jgi:transmembrane sensor
MTRESISGLSDERWEALARFLAGECNAGQAEEMRAWLAERPDRRELADTLETALRGLAFETPADLDVEGALARTRARLEEPVVLPIGAPQEPQRAFRRTSLLRLAASVALIIGAGVVWRATRPEAPPTQSVAVQTHVTATGQTESLRLSDGSSVLLAPGSRLVVAAGYGGTARDVELTGEALFDVMHDAARPFTVRAGDAAIEDLGTTFAVRSSGVNGVQVVVTEGAVRLRAVSAPVDAGIVLHAGQRGTLAMQTGDIAQGAVTDEDLAWTRGRLVFTDASLDRVRDDLRRWYGIELQVIGRLPGRLNAEFEGYTVEKVLEIIGLTLGAEIDLRGDTAIMRVQSGATTR